MPGLDKLLQNSSSLWPIFVLKRMLKAFILVHVWSKIIVFLLYREYLKLIILYSLTIVACIVYKEVVMYLVINIHNDGFIMYYVNEDILNQFFKGLISLINKIKKKKIVEK